MHTLLLHEALGHIPAFTEGHMLNQGPGDPASGSVQWDRLLGGKVRPPEKARLGLPSGLALAAELRAFISSSPPLSFCDFSSLKLSL